MKNITPCHFSESLEQAHEFHNGALEFLEEYKVPPIPTNYAIAYEYTSKRSSALNDEIEVHLSRTGHIDGYILADLFERFFLQNQAEEIDGYIANLHEIFINALEGVSGASEGVNDFSKVLETQRGKLEGNPGIEGVQSIVSTLMDATEQAHTSNKQLRSHLEETEKETSHMRNELEKMRKEAATDGLTGLFNRKELNSRLDDLLEKDPGLDKPLSILMLDIDHFKRINDNFGHQIGDEVIRKVAKTLQKYSIGNSFAARYGGEEFTLVMPEIDISRAVEIGTSINEAVSKLVLVRRTTKERLPPVSISVGAASFKHGEDQDDLLGRADQALYHAKNNGRNQVVSDMELSIRR